jgi:hypothetical protein
MPVPSGALRFNSDSGKLEYYNGEAWWQIDSFTPDSDTGGARGVFFGVGGTNTPLSQTSRNTIDYITISTTGNSIDFGDIANPKDRGACCASTTRGVFGGGFGQAPTLTPTSTIEYVTISSTGNAVSFGNLTGAKDNLGGCSNSTRGLFMGGSPTPAGINVIEYITIASTGNGVDFGDLATPQGQQASCASSTRGFSGAGYSSTAQVNTIEFVTISTLGNAADFGDLPTTSHREPTACSNAIRGVWAGGYSVNVVEYITMSSLGNGQDFGDLTQHRGFLQSAASSTRGTFAGGGFSGPQTFTNIIDYITIMSTGNAIDYGDLIGGGGKVAGGLSNGHGGL